MSLPDYYRSVSLVLSRVMNDIGVNEECVMRRRRAHVLKENLDSLSNSLIQQPSTNHIFGSQTEGSTTQGLKSDTDTLVTFDDRYVIQDWKDWSPGISNYMMIQDETTFAGYCKLQILRPDMPLLYDILPDQYHVYDEKRRIILKNDYFCTYVRDEERHGPALQSHEFIKRGIDADTVLAFYCPTWPKHYKQWSLRREVRDWPTPEMVDYMETSGCFVVPVGHRCAARPETDWRISTSLAERCLMFSLNITQIRCYVLLKMITKTFIEPFVPDVISSYICKTLLFHNLERMSRDFWREQNLLACVTRVLFSMYSAVYNMDCPNYFNGSANLLLGKLDQEGTRERLLLILRKLLNCQGVFLLQIGFDDINSRIKKYFLNSHLTVRYEENEHKRLICYVEFSVKAIGYIVRTLLKGKEDLDSTFRLDLLKNTLDYSRKGSMQYIAASMLFPFLCSHIATVDTSERIRRGQNVSPRALLMYKFSLDSDAASSRLRYASFLYCTRQFERSLSVLQQVEHKMNAGVISVCGCLGGMWLNKDKLGIVVQERGNAFLPTANVGLCVMFFQAESQCCPLQMRY